MSPTLRHLITDHTDPYINLALEELILERVQLGEIIFLLWQNCHTVVIGRNQNAWRECRIAELEQDGGFLARRRSGGGAVYHDMGNLNFSFIAHDAEYNPEKHYEVIISAMHSLGLTAEQSGRNDLVIDDRKFSGNAFFSKNGRFCHHGTILIDTDSQAMGRYLQVSSAKLQSKGVVSVQSRIVNLCELLPELTVEKVRLALLDAFMRCYDGNSQMIDEASLNADRLTALRDTYASWEWRFGQRIAFTQTMQQRFSWGEIELQLKVDEGHIQEVAAYSDALNTEIVQAIARALQGMPFIKDKLLETLSLLPKTDEHEQQMVTDINALIQSQI